MNKYCSPVCQRLIMHNCYRNIFTEALNLHPSKSFDESGSPDVNLSYQILRTLSAVLAGTFDCAQFNWKRKEICLPL